MNDGEAERRWHLLVALRGARAQLRYVADEIDGLGIMLKFGGITMREAINWIDGLGASHLVADIIYRDMAEDESVEQIEQEGENHGDETNRT